MEELGVDLPPASTLAKWAPRLDLVFSFDQHCAEGTGAQCFLTLGTCGPGCSLVLLMNFTVCYFVQQHGVHSQHVLRPAQAGDKL